MFNNVTTYSVYDGEKPILEVNPDGQVIATTTYGRGIDEILYRNNYGSAQYFLQDRNNNTLAVAGGDGKILESYRYDAFGAPTFFDQDGNGIETTLINNRFLFTGREYDAKFGFYEYRARAYHPVLGRFMSEDPVGFQIAGTKPSAALRAMFPSLSETFANSEFNLYRYCANDPLDKSDPMGLIITILGNDEFKRKVKEQIDSTRKLSPALDNAYKELRDSPRTHTITPADDSNNRAGTGPDGHKGNRNDASHGTIWDRVKSWLSGRTGSTTYYNPDNRYTSYGDRDPRAALAHEFFGHGLDRDRGTWSTQQYPQPPVELRAIWFENQARQAIDGSQRSYDYYHPSVTYP